MIRKLTRLVLDHNIVEVDERVSYVERPVRILDRKDQIL